ncbi:MAG: hypothetical protein WAM94_14315, partial [Chromatiaceae bacterium]
MGRLGVRTWVILVAGALSLGPEAPAGEKAGPDSLAADTTRLREAVVAMRGDLAPLIQSAQKRFKIPAISIALVRGHAVLWSEGFGLADVATRRAATPDTLY